VKGRAKAQGGLAPSSVGEIADPMSRNFTSPTCVDLATLLMLEDEALPPEEMAAVYAHLDGCRACQMLARELAGLRRTALAFAGGRAAEDCPDASALGAFAERTLQAADRETITKHLASCGRCTADLAALMSELEGISAETETPIPAEILARARALVPASVGHASADTARTATAELGWFDRLVLNFRRLSFPVAAAAALAIIALVQVPAPVVQSPTVRADQVPGTSMIVLAIPAEGGALHGSHRVLSWEPLTGADTYEITVVDETGGMVWTGQTLNPWIDCPLAVPLVPGARYAWWVTSGLESGERARSSVRRFVYEP
jgi:hypothetical protein